MIALDRVEEVDRTKLVDAGDPALGFPQARDVVPGGVQSVLRRSARPRPSTEASPRAIGPARAQACCITGFTCTKAASAGARTRNMATPFRGACTRSSSGRPHWVRPASYGCPGSSSRPAVSPISLYSFTSSATIPGLPSLRCSSRSTSSPGIGAFALLLAPGFHWYRELVLLAVPAILHSGCLERVSRRGRGAQMAEAHRGGRSAHAVLARRTDVLSGRGLLRGGGQCCG